MIQTQATKSSTSESSYRASLVPTSGSDFRQVDGKGGYAALPIPYIGKRDLEFKKPEQQKAHRDVVLERELDAVDRKETMSIPGRVDAQEVSALVNLGPETIRAFEAAWKAIDDHNNKIHKWQWVASLAGVAIGLGGAWLFGGGVLWALGSLGVSLLGNLVKGRLNKLLEDPTLIANLEKIDPKLGKILEQIDRKEYSEPFYLDEAEFQKLTPEQQDKYMQILREVASHNKRTQVETKALSIGGQIASLAANILPKLITIPFVGTKTVATLAAIYCQYRTAQLGKRIVSVHSGEADPKLAAPAQDRQAPPTTVKGAQAWSTFGAAPTQARLLGVA